MNRLIQLVPLTLVAAFCSDASAQFTNTISLKPTFKETKEGGATCRNVFIEGTARLPDGVVLKVGVRPVDDAEYLQWVQVTVKNQDWRAEMGPWLASFPAGVYACEAWFEFDRQSDSVQKDLMELEEFRRCPNPETDPQYAGEYKLQNPERFKELLDAYAHGVSCVSRKQFGCKNLTIGTAEQEAESNEEVRGFLRDHANLARDLAKEILETNAKYADANRPASLNQESYLAWANEMLGEIQKTDLKISNRLRSSIRVKHRSAHSTLSNAFIALSRFLDSSLALQSGKLADDIRELNAQMEKGASNLDMDQKRRVRSIKFDVAAVEADRVSAFRLMAEGVIDTLYGPMGLDPAPEKAKLELQKFQADSGISWEK